MKNFCTISMRGGSKGLSNKNLRELHGKPLMAYTIEQAIQSKLFEHVVVSTDSRKIAETAKLYGAESWFLRPSKLATDEAPKLPAIRHALIESEKYYGCKFDVLVDLDVTSPLRKIKDIIGAYKCFKKENADILITACLARKNPYFNMVELVNGNVDLVKNNNLREITVEPNLSINEALVTLSKSGEKCLLVKGDENKLLGTLSDGDIRKAIINGAKLDRSIDKIFNRKPTSLIENNFDYNVVRKVFINHKFDIIPIVDKENRLVDFISWEEIFSGSMSNIKQKINLSVKHPTRRQDAPKVYDMNASIYIWKRRALIENDTLFTNKTSLYIMPEERSLDIDTELDWNIIEYLIANKSDVVS